MTRTSKPHRTLILVDDAYPENAWGPADDDACRSSDLTAAAILVLGAACWVAAPLCWWFL